MDDLKYIIAKNIINLRVSQNMTQLRLGEILNYSDKAVSKWERAEAVPDAYVLKQLSNYFHVSVDYIMTDHTFQKAKKYAATNHVIHNHIISISIIGVWTLALLVFIFLWIIGYSKYMVFVYTVPISLIVLLILNTLWGQAKNNFYIISALVWSTITAIYLSFLQYNWWLLFVLGIPAELIIFFCFKIYSIYHNR
jgi:Predicted transcriptional regulators